jgi:hypothetical protein
MNKLLLCIILLSFSSLSFANDVVAVLDLKFQKETEDVAAWMCYGENEDDCHPWAYFYVFNAEVKEVISGELKKNRITVIFGRHALKKGNHKNVIATLSKLTESTVAEYQIREWGTKKSMYCFSNEENKLYNVRLESSNADLRCYEKQ